MHFCTRFDAGNPIVIEPDGAFAVPAVERMNIVRRHIQDTVGYMKSIVSLAGIPGKINGWGEEGKFRFDGAQTMTITAESIISL